MLIKDLPKELQELIRKRQAEYFLTEDFILPITEKDTVSGALNWEKSPEGIRFWGNVSDGDYKLFYEQYPEFSKSRVQELADKLGVKIQFI